jgi:tetratricopeptide (TPR) repeat protein
LLLAGDRNLSLDQRLWLPYGLRTNSRVVGIVTQAPRLAIPELVQLGFAAQLNGRLLEAAERYEEVLKLDPLHFDATHMLGVVQYHRGRFDDALRLLKRAVQLQPNVAEARGNLEIVETARQREQELCRGVLPRLAPLVEQVDNIASLAATVSVVHLAIMQSLTALDRAFLEAIVVMASATQVRFWADAEARASDFRNANVIDYSAGLHPAGGMLVLFGAEFSPIAWLDRARPELSLLVVTRDEPGLLLDRIRQLSGEGSHRVGLLCCGSALANRLPFPAGVVVAQATVAARDLQ